MLRMKMGAQPAKNKGDRITRKMRILAIETTGKYGSAAATDDAGQVFCASSRTEMDHLRGIVSLIDEAVRASGAGKGELTHVAASVGPGSFTGIRIGVTTARTISQMLGIPCIGISSLEAMAEGAPARALPSEALYVVPVINARRHQTYAAAYEVASDTDSCQRLLIPVMEEKQYMIEELLGSLEHKLAEHSDSKVYFTGDGIDAYGDIIEELLPAGSYVFAPEGSRYQNAVSVARLALKKAEAGEVLSYDELMPEYMRLAEAEQRLRAGTLSERIRKPL